MDMIILGDHESLGCGLGFCCLIEWKPPCYLHGEKPVIDGHRTCTHYILTEGSE